jgi:hypothetical protein
VAQNPVITQNNFMHGGTTVLGNVAYVPNSPPGTNAVTNFDVTSLIQSMVTGGTPYVGISFGIAGIGSVNIPGTPSPSLSLTSSSQLVVPEPPGALLMALGLTGVSVLIGVRSWKPAHRRPACAQVIAMD